MDHDTHQTRYCLNPDIELMIAKQTVFKPNIKYSICSSNKYIFLFTFTKMQQGKKNSFKNNLT